METIAYHFHCDDQLGSKLPLRAKTDDEVHKACWIDVNPHSDFRYANLYASHREMVDRVAAAMRGTRIVNEPPLGAASGGRVDRESFECKDLKRKPLHVPQPKSQCVSDRVISPWSDLKKDYNPSDAKSQNNQQNALDIDSVLHQRLTYEGPIMFKSHPSGSYDQLPLNPRGRTGLSGQGTLPCLGPLQTVTMLITRRHPVTQELQLVLVHRGQKSKPRPLADKKTRRGTFNRLSLFQAKPPSSGTPHGDSPEQSTGHWDFPGTPLKDGDVEPILNDQTELTRQPRRKLMLRAKDIFLQQAFAHKCECSGIRNGHLNDYAALCRSFACALLSKSIPLNTVGDGDNRIETAEKVRRMIDDSIVNAHVVRARSLNPKTCTYRMYTHHHFSCSLLGVTVQLNCGRCTAATRTIRARRTTRGLRRRSSICTATIRWGRT